MVMFSVAPKAESSGPVVGFVQSDVVEGGVTGAAGESVRALAADRGSMQVNERDESGNTDAGGNPPCIPITPGMPARHSLLSCNHSKKITSLSTSCTWCALKVHVASAVHDLPAHVVTGLPVSNNSLLQKHAHRRVLPQLVVHRL